MNLQDELQVNKRVRRLTLISSVIGISVAGMSTRIFMISVPTLATALGTDILGISWALIVYQVAAIGLGVICGRLGDMYGHHKMYGLGMTLMAVGSLLCGLSQNVLQLILFRFVQGVGGAMIQSSGRTLGYKSMPQGSEGKAQGLMAMSHQFGFFIGPPIGGLIIDLVNWRGIFFLLLLPSLVVLALSLMAGRSVAESGVRSRSVDYLGALLFFTLTIVVTMFLDQKIAVVIGPVNQALLFLTFVGLLWGFVCHEKKTPSPMIDLNFFSTRVFGYGSLGLFMACITQGLTLFVTPFYLQDVLNLSPTFMGVIFLVPSLLSMILAPVSGALTDRIGARFLLIVGVLILMLAFCIGANLRTDSHWILPTILLALTGMGSTIFNTPSQAMMVSSLPKEHWGIAIGVINGIFGLGQMLGISLSGIFLTLAFRFYSGDPGTIPNPGDTHIFVSSVNVTYLFALGISFVPLLTSIKSKKTPFAEA
ncbi:MAG TPA: MFS transporter [Candidatus Binatia bacterium]